MCNCLLLFRLTSSALHMRVHYNSISTNKLIALKKHWSSSIYGMGHYCFLCSEKLSGGFVPTCCSGYECVCTRCKNDLLIGRCPVSLAAYVKANGIYAEGCIAFVASKKLKKWLEGEAKCPKCKKSITEKDFQDY